MASVPPLLAGRARAGFSLVESLIGLLVLGFVAFGLVRMGDRLGRDSRAQNTLSQLDSAVATYLAYLQSPAILRKSVARAIAAAPAGALARCMSATINDCPAAMTGPLELVLSDPPAAVDFLTKGPSWLSDGARACATCTLKAEVYFSGACAGGTSCASPSVVFEARISEASAPGRAPRSRQVRAAMLKSKLRPAASADCGSRLFLGFDPAGAILCADWPPKTSCAGIQVMNGFKPDGTINCVDPPPNL